MRFENTAAAGACSYLSLYVNLLQQVAVERQIAVAKQKAEKIISMLKQDSIRLATVRTRIQGCRKLPKLVAANFQ